VISGLAQQLSQNQQQKPPQWKKVSDKPTFTWHDHRTHWMAQQKPPTVAADPHHAHKVFDASMDLLVDNQPVAVNGTLSWIGSPVIGGLAIALMVTGGTAVVAVLGLLLVRRRLARKKSEAGDLAGQPDHELVS
jgi:hypothetical protein